MKAIELRIGNKLQKDNGAVFTVTRLDNTNDVLVYEQRGLLTLGYNLFGIPLTESWLLEFGFIDYRSNRNTCTKKAYFDIKIGYYQKTPDTKPKQSNFRILHKGDVYNVISPGNGSINLKYVHQLQNLYFALTGNELVIK